jgi:hypothetical protein
MYFGKKTVFYAKIDGLSEMGNVLFRKKICHIGYKKTENYVMIPKM